MRTSARVSTVLGALCVLASNAWGQAAPAEKSEVAKRIEQALASPIRTEEERKRDARERKPVETLEFFGLQPNMTVVELLPGQGWYTKVLAPVLADQGKLYVAMGSRTVAGKLAEWKLDKVQVVDVKTELKPTDQYGIYGAESVDIPVQNVDMVLTFRNYHNFTPATRAMINREVFEMLKPGGIYGIVDHTRRHNEPPNSETWRRSDPVVVIEEVLAAGFELVGHSNLHYRPDDDLRYDTQRESIAGFSDRFTLKFRKPATP